MLNAQEAHKLATFHAEMYELHGRDRESFQSLIVEILRNIESRAREGAFSLEYQVYQQTKVNELLIDTLIESGYQVKVTEPAIYDEILFQPVKVEIRW